MSKSKGPSFFQLIIQWLLAMLFRLLAQPWTARFYNAAAPLFALTAVETVFLRKDEPGQYHVLLHRRPETDIPEWRGRPASPGSMLRATDCPGRESGYIDALYRVRRELGGTQFIFTPSPVHSLFQHTERGPENGIVIVCELLQDPPAGFWWHSIRDLPPNILKHHPEIIKIASLHADRPKVPFSVEQS